MSFQDDSQRLGLAATMGPKVTLRERLDRAVRETEERLAAAKEAKDLFDRNPDIEKLLDIIRRANF